VDTALAFFREKLADCPELQVVERVALLSLGLELLLLGANADTAFLREELADRTELEAVQRLLALSFESTGNALDRSQAFRGLITELARGVRERFIKAERFPSNRCVGCADINGIGDT